MIRPTGLVQFDGFEFDWGSLELLEDGDPVRLQPQPAQVLAALLARPGRLVTRDELRDTIWAGRFIEFDAGLNFSILQIRKALGETAGAPRYIETVPRRGYRFIGPLGSGSKGAMATTGGHGKPLLGAGLVAATIAGLLFAAPWQGTPPPAAASPLMLAVLPVTNLTDDERLERFSLGLMEDLVTELSKLNPSALGVIAPNSTRTAEQRGLQLPQYASQLGVDYLVHTSVRQTASGRRINVRLEGTADGATLWADRWDESSATPAVTQAVIGRAVAEALSVEILGAPRLTGEVDLSASQRETWLTARWFMSGQRDIPRALAGLDSLRASAPRYAPAWRMAAQGLRWTGDLAGAETTVLRAIELDPEAAESHYELGHIMARTARIDVALAEYERAVELGPGIAKHHQWFAQVLADVLRFDEAVQHLEIARTLDPISTSIDGDLGIVLVAAGRSEEAVAHCSRGIDLLPENEWARRCLFNARYFNGELKLAQAAAQWVLEYHGATDDELAAASGDPQEAIWAYFEWNLRYFEAQNADWDASYQIAQAHARLGHREEALEWLTKVAEARLMDILWSARERWFEVLHGDPRYEAILRGAGLPVPTSRPASQRILGGALDRNIMSR